MHEYPTRVFDFVAFQPPRIKKKAASKSITFCKTPKLLRIMIHCFYRNIVRIVVRRIDSVTRSVNTAGEEMLHKNWPSSIRS